MLAPQTQAGRQELAQRRELAQKRRASAEIGQAGKRTQLVGGSRQAPARPRDGPAEALLSALRAVYPAVAANEPWSGKDGLIYSAERHAHRHGRIALELEVRQDLATDATWRQQLVAVLVDFYRKGK